MEHMSEAAFARLLLLDPEGRTRSDIVRSESTLDHQPTGGPQPPFATYAPRSPPSSRIAIESTLRVSKEITTICASLPRYGVR
jgi:hypothetical protein